MSHDRRPDNGNPWSGFAGHEEVVIAEAEGVLEADAEAEASAGVLADRSTAPSDG